MPHRRASPMPKLHRIGTLGFRHQLLGAKPHDEPLTALTQPVELTPDWSDAQGSLGTCLALVGRPEEVFARLQMAIRSDPGDPGSIICCSGLAHARHHPQPV